MDLVEVRVERIHEGDIEAVLPDALGAAGVDAVVVPGAVRREDEVARAELQAFAIDHGVRAAPLHDEAQRGRLMAVSRSEFAGVHDLNPGVEQAGRGAPLSAPRVYQHDDAARRLLCRYK